MEPQLNCSAPPERGGAQNLITMSTPAGRLSFLNSSTVLAVGSMMPINRLCVDENVSHFPLR
jgi:hypothetical protein